MMMMSFLNKFRDLNIVLIIVSLMGIKMSMFWLILYKLMAEKVKVKKKDINSHKEILQ